MALQRSTCLGDFGAPGDRPPVSDLPPQSSANRPRNYSQNLSLTLPLPWLPRRSLRILASTFLLRVLMWCLKLSTVVAVQVFASSASLLETLVLRSHPASLRCAVHLGSLTLNVRADPTLRWSRLSGLFLVLAWPSAVFAGRRKVRFKAPCLVAEFWKDDAPALVGRSVGPVPCLPSPFFGIFRMKLWAPSV
jgi:hypothetical protein